MKSLLIFLLTFPAILFSQQATVDSLQSLLDKTSDQKEQARLMNLLADGYKGVDPMKTREFAEKAYGIGSKLNNKQIQADALHKKGLSYYYLDSYDTAISYYRQSLMMADGIKDSSLTAQAYSGIGNVYRLQGVNDTALFYLQKALEIYTEQKDQKNIAAALSTIGDTYLYAGDYDKALDDYNQALGIARKIKDKYREAFCLSSIGNNYFMRGDFQKCIDSHEQSISVSNSINEENMVAGSLGTIAGAYAEMYDYPKAIETYLRALDLALKKKDKHNTSFIYAGMADIYKRQNENDSALKYLNMSTSLAKQIQDFDRTCDGELTMAAMKTEMNDTLEARKLADDAISMAIQYSYPNHQATGLRVKAVLLIAQKRYTDAETLLRTSIKLWEDIGDKQQLTETRKSLVKTLVLENKTDEAIAEGEKGFAMAKEISSPGLQLDIAEVLSTAYEQKGDFEKALHFSRLVKSLSDSVNSQESTKRQTELFLKYKFDKEQEQQQLAQDKLNAEQDAKFRQQKIIIYAAAIAILLVLSLAFFIYRGYRQKQKANNLVTEQKMIVEEKNREITDSINYAKNIQVAMLPSDNSVRELFPDHFILFKPRDIVSGDFYWIGERDGLKFFAISDCTGHGVPGGFMSMLGITVLNEILAEKGITSPDKMLNELRTQIIQSLNRARKAGETLARDGMDISICCIDHKKMKLYYAGANNAVYIANANGISELSPDKQPVGVHEKMFDFNLHQKDLAEGDVIIAFSDGYPDQFGGPAGKKFMYRRFKEIIEKNHNTSMPQLGEVLDKEFENWKGELPQVDDVCVFGIRI
ncbi:MAG TPA: tetratricopeptide repeat protein [Bacteroidia bacterium]|jgi:serine phosphatase RsbU (regulator of sigma subunit)/tetratricopeptide (TPR) repeat protein|nr:tetratricopeptide repeat protein [Bacteroidia bacterium]